MKLPPFKLKLKITHVIGGGTKVAGMPVKWLKQAISKVKEWVK